MSESQDWQVYVLECRNGRLYTGVSTDPARRFAEHASGKGAMFTRLNAPERLLGSCACASRGEALSLEYRIKQMTAAEKRRLAASWLRAEPAPPASDSPAPPAKPAS